MKLIETDSELDELIKLGLESAGAINVKTYNMDTGSRVIFSIENEREHISISNKKRLPTWDEIKYVRYKLMSEDITVAQILPPKDQYVNIHENCFHLWQIKDEEFDY